MRAITIMYHDVVAADAYDASGFPGNDAALYKLEREEFENHLLEIQVAVGDKPVRVFELSPRRGKTPFLLTFDDGGASAHSCIADLLEAHRWHGHFFITADRVGTQSFLTPDQIRDLHRRGHVIGTHSLSHPARMSHCNAEELIREWTRSVELLSDIIGSRITAASVPGGFHSPRVAEAAAQAGIKALFTSEPTMRCYSVEGCLVLGRYTIQRWMSPRAAGALACGRLMPRLQQLIIWNAKKAAKALGGDLYPQLRKLLLRQG